MAFMSKALRIAAVLTFSFLTANDGQATKVGTATCTSILWFAWGDASLDAAMKNGGITKIHHVDWNAFNILGIIFAQDIFCFWMLDYL